MATIRFRGDAPAVAQVNTITPANVNIGNTFTVTINGKAITFTATAATVANVTAGLTTLLNASTAPPEFQEITFADATTHITATADTAGKPFTQTSSAAGGTATNVTATTTASSGPNDLSIAANYTGAALPSNGDTLIFENTSVDALYGLTAISAVTLASLIVRANYTGKIGLPAMTQSGYYEYRPAYFVVGATAMTIGDGPGQGSGRIKIDTGSVQTTINVYATGSPAETSVESFLWKGTHASNALNVNKGSVGVAVFSGEVATLATWSVGYVSNVNSDSKLRLGSGVTQTTGTMNGGTVEDNSALTTLTKYAGTYTHRAGAITTLTNIKGEIAWLASSTITTYYGGNESDFNAAEDERAFTITNCTLAKGAKLRDPDKRTTFTNGIDLSYCGIEDVDLLIGKHLTVTPSAI